MSSETQNPQDDALQTLKSRVAPLEQTQSDCTQAENAHQVAETRYQAIMSAFPDLISRINRAGVYLEVNTGNEKMLLAPRDSYVGKTVYDLMPSDIADQVLQYIRLALDTGFIQVTEYRLPISVAGPDREGRIVVCGPDEVLLIERDITQRKLMEKTLSQYTRRLNISHNLHQGVLAGLPFEDIISDALQGFSELVPCQFANLTLFDLENRQSLLVISVRNGQNNPSTVEQIALVEEGPFKNVPSGEQKIIEDLVAFSETHILYQRLLDKGIHSYLSIPVVAEKKLIAELGLGAEQPGYFSIGHRAIASQFADQLAAAMSYVHLRQKVQRHNTELQQHVNERTAELERTRSRVEAILNNSSDAIILARADGNISQTNWMFDQMFQYQPDELFRQPLISVVHPDSAEVFHTALHAVAAGEGIKRFEITACRKDKTTFDAEVGLSFIRVIEENQRGGIVCHLRDITDRKQAEAKLIKALQQERELGELKTRFISMASHEFRTPLTTILSSTDILGLYIDRLNAEQKGKHFSKIRSAVQHMTQLLDDVLLMGKVEAGQFPFTPTFVEVIPLAQDVLEQVRLLAGPHIEFSVSMECERETIWADEKLMRHMFTNLLTNAIKYSPNGGIVHFEVHCEAQNLLFRVQDQGIGIPLQDQEWLFEPFHRADNVGTIQGTGLGLAITKRAVYLHGGTIIFESQVGAGTTFIITIPIKPAEEMTA